MHYYSLGQIPAKRHVQYRKPDGQLYHEELFSTEGFSNNYSILYHCNPPTQIIQVGEPWSVQPKGIHDKQLKHRCLNGWNVKPGGDYLESRTPLLFNTDCIISVAAPTRGLTDKFYKNADSDELIFIHKGTGALRTMYGTLRFEYGDYPENNWVTKRIRIGAEVLLQLTDPCPRCAVPTLAQHKLPKDAKLLKNIAATNTVHVPALQSDQPCLGAYAFVLHGGMVSLGDEVTLE